MLRCVLIFLSLAAACVSCQRKEIKTPPPREVNAFQVEAHTLPADFEFVAVARSSHAVEIRSRVEGYLKSIDYVEGSLVNENALLFRIDPAQFVAEVDEAKGELERQEAVLWRAKRSVERLGPLFLRNATSLRDLDNAIAQMLAGQASVISANANLVKAKLNLSYTEIISPIKGLTGRAVSQPGALITPNVNGLLTYVSIIDPIWVLFSISGSELLEARSEKGQERLILPAEDNYTVYLTFSNGKKFPYPGKVNFSSPILNPKTGAMMIRAEFPNPDAELMPGQFVTAKITGACRPDAIAVPQTAVFQSKNGLSVFVIDPTTQTVSLRPIVEGAWYKNYWIIKKGLHVGEWVVANGVNNVQEGSVVKIVSTTCFEDAGS